MNIRIWMLGLLVCSQLLATGLFLKGYFPLKKSVEGYADISKTPPFPGTSNTEPLEPIFGRLVIILIDALRWDFVLGEEGNIGMPNTRGVIDKRSSISLLATADSPTVTMPRIKALMTGGVPGFVDVVLNFDSTALLEDNLLHQFMTSERKIVFYGDDTWIRLFPEHFLREEGTTSFFVADYTEVDVNVTRHIDQEMLSDDWDVMILHYLGLDHIGHLAGSTSPLLGPKLKEMDHVVQKIHRALIEKDKHSAKPSLLLLCGDHGMSEQGSHGGATPAETTTPLIFLSSLFNNGKGQTFSKECVRQIDLVPTLSLLLGVPVPQNNLGVAIPQALSYHSPGDRLRAMQLNADQVLSLLKQNVQDYQREEGVLLHSRATQLHARWLALYDTGTVSNTTLHQLANTTMDMYQSATKSARDKISSTLTTYDTHALVVAIFILYLVFLVEVDFFWRPLRTRSINLFFFMGSCITLASIQTIWCTSHSASSLMCNTVPASIVISLAVLIILSSLIALIGSSLIESMQGILQRTGAEKSKGLWSKGLGPKGIGVIGILLVIGNGLHVFSLLSSSFIEEEHQTWYFLTTTLHLTILACVLRTMLPLSSNFLSHHDSVSSAPIMSSPLPDSTPLRYNLRNRNAKLQKNTQARTYDEIDATQCRQTIVNNRTYNALDDSCELKEISLTENTTRNCRTPSVKVVFCGCLMTLCGRVMRVWNQTGDKWRHLPDVGDWLVRPENQGILSYSAMGGLCLIWALRQRYHSAVGKMMLMGGCSMVYLFRACQGTLLAPYEYDGAPSKGVNEARSVFVIMAVLLVIGWRQRKHHYIYEALLSVWLLLMCLLLRPHNIPIVALSCIQESCLRAILPYISTSLPLLTLVYHWMGQASFFYQGNSNSISTVDVSAGYVGLDSYSPSVIGVLMGVSTYAGPLFWMLALLCTQTSLSQDKSQKCTQNYNSPHDYLVIGLTLTMCRTMTLCVFTVLATLQRYHLFVWTVFSPKLLYEAMFTLVIVLVTLLYAICAWVS
ncbi:unnamed protein product [Owenia fusiformis]|uniref:GPI ethanolamine phosphate transferase 2 C-terminal domain-containing protein n=1 Tax=Owenia fusiformis TaxID=6347 RepID=A0A8S4MZZ7_OWEFU|nr:unnamed protein product [Owenia fusiformis]